MTATTKVAATESRRVLPVAIGKAITSAVKASIASGNAMGKAADLLFSLEVQVEWLYAPKKGHDDDILRVADVVTTHREFFDEVELDVVAAFSAAQRKLLDTPTKGMSDSDKREKREIKHATGSKRKDLRNSLARRWKRIEDEASAPSRTRDLNTRINEYINGAIKCAQAADPEKDGIAFDVTALVTCLEKARKIANTAI